MLSLPFWDTRLSLIEPTLTLFGLALAVNGREDVSSTSIVAWSPMRWSETVAFSDAAQCFRLGGAGRRLAAAPGVTP